MIVKNNEQAFRAVMILFVVLAVFRAGHPSRALELSSTNYKVQDSAITPAGGGYSSSDNFKLLSSMAQISAGTSTATTFKLNTGFLFYPFASSPVVTASAGNGQVALSWTVPTVANGWSVGGYEVGRSTASGGPYTYTDVGNVTSSTRTSLSNGTGYYFIIRVYDSFSNPIATSTEVASTPTAPSSSGSSISSGGGNAGVMYSSPSNTQTAQPAAAAQAGTPVAPVAVTEEEEEEVTLTGRAYPNAEISIIKDGEVVETVLADERGHWKATVAVDESATFSVYAVDEENNYSLSTSIVVSGGVSLSEVISPPTVVADKSEVKAGNVITFFGKAYPESLINIIINSETTITDTTRADKAGDWSYALDSKLLEGGDHSFRSQTVAPDGVTSPFSEITFKIGDKDVPFMKATGLYPAGGLAEAGTAPVPETEEGGSSTQPRLASYVVGFGIFAWIALVVYLCWRLLRKL